MPWIVNGFFKLISPFIDPLTKEKLKFNEDMRQHAPPEQLWNEFQGDLEFEYEHSIYWPALMQVCQEKRREKKERWVTAGKHYGESEHYLKGGDSPRVGKAASDEVAADSAVQEKEEKENIPAEPIQENGTAIVPTGTSGTQVDGNADILAQRPDPAITTEGDQA